MKTREEARPSLLDLFTAPGDKRRGVFGLVCGLSADEQFMDSVLERFSGRNKIQRLHNGHFSLALFVDIHNKPLQGLPGLVNPSPSRNISEKTSLMHAKVALLGFGESAAGTPDYYRLIVSTGNWTKEAVNNSINLVWSCDYDLGNRDGKEQEAKDLIESVYFWQNLLGINSERSGYYQVDGPTKERISTFLRTIAKDIAVPGRKYSPRFISNILENKAALVSQLFQPNSMGAQVIERFVETKLRRNSIICGSGFFEQPGTGKQNGPPEVLNKLIQTLTDRKILTADPYQRLVINPKTSGAVGQWIKNTNAEDLDWSICPPKHPDSEKSNLHAKYVYIGNDNDNSLTSGLLYLGSGNLSKQGFALTPSTGGNVEAGVIVEVGRHGSVSELAPQLGFDEENDLDAAEIPDLLESEEDEQAGDERQLPPPIVSCFWSQATSKLSWQWTDTDCQEVTLHGQAVEPPTVELSVSEEKPNFSLGVRISAKISGTSCNWIIPVFSEGSTFCRPPIVPRTGQEIIDALEAFPQYSCEDDELEGEEGEEYTETTIGGQKDDFSELRNELDRFPLHLATTLLETIADQNQRITFGQLPDWTAHLRRILKDEMKPETKAQLMTLGCDILAPLVSEKGFAPKRQVIDAEPTDVNPTGTQTTDQYKDYEEAMTEIANDWKFHAEKATPAAN